MSNYRYNETVTIFRQQRYDGEWPPENLERFIAWFQAHLESIPAEYRKKAVVKIDSESSWEDSHYASIEISYDRPPTPEEVLVRKQEDQQRRDAEIAHTEARLARLRSGGY